MGRYNGAVVTSAGQALFAEAIAGGTPVLFTKMRTSSTVIPDGTNLESLTLSEGLTRIGDSAFNCCQELKSSQKSGYFLILIHLIYSIYFVFQVLVDL